MKLTNFGALIFRILGALFCIAAVGELIYGITDLLGIHRDPTSARDWDAIASGLWCMAIGFGMIYFSKKIAALFCRGLEDEI